MRPSARHYQEDVEDVILDVERLPTSLVAMIKDATKDMSPPISVNEFYEKLRLTP